jgi:tRNA 2-thiouridine synthesizing protein B
MSTLFILHRSPYSTLEMNDAIRLAKVGDGIVLTQDAVLAVRSVPQEDGIEEASRKNIRIYAIKADMEARSLKEVGWVKIIDYDGLVELLGQYESTWS